MQLFIDYLPVVLFFGTYVATKDIYISVGVLMVAAPVVLLIQWLITHKLGKINLVSTVLILILGGLTLAFHNPLFLFWKPTILYWIIAGVFLSSQFYGDKTMVKRMLDATIKEPSDRFELTPGQWSRLNLIWIAFFTIAGCVNIFVAYRFSQAAWVNFKLFGMLGMTLLFVIGQTLWITSAARKNGNANIDNEI